MKLPMSFSFGTTSSNSYFKDCFPIFLFKKSFVMELVLFQLENKASWKQSMRKTCKNNKLNTEIVTAYTPLRFRASYTRFKAIYQRRSADKAQRWLQNQLKAFYWFLIALSCHTQINIQDFTGKEWKIIFEVFSFKQSLTLEYESKKLIEESASKQNWQVQEQKLLTSIVQESQEHGNKWNQFARKLYELSEQKFFRTGKQCRQRWLNHLDPNKKHGEWQPEQDIELAKMFIEEGKKWSLVSKKLGGSRTEHMVKNRFKTIVGRQKKLHPQIANEFYLLKTFLDPQCAEKYIKKENAESQIKKQPEVIITEKASCCEEVHRVEVQVRPEIVNSSQIDQFIKDDENDVKHVPQTSSAYQLPPPYSPWYVITPTFSPYYVNMSTFSMFEANFITNQFQCPKSERCDLD